MLFLSKTVWERRRKREKNFSPEFCSYPSRANISKKKKLKNWKTSFRRYFFTNRDEIRWEREKKNLVPNPVHTRPGQKILKKIEKEIKKLKNLFAALFIAKTGLDRPRKRKKKFYFRIPFIVDRSKKIPKKIAKNWKNLKTSFRHYF